MSTGPGGLLVLSRGEFIARYWTYRPGEHVTIIAPTGYGKTWWTNDLLMATMTPRLPAVVLATKPADPTMDRLLRASALRRVTAYPERGLGQVTRTVGLTSEGTGAVVWPPHTGDPRRDVPAHREVFRRAVLWDYGRNARGAHRRLRGAGRARPAIVNVDEIYGATAELKLGPELGALWTRGRSVGIGLWGGTQRPFDVPQLAYSQPQHLFLGWTPDQRDRQRFREIGGTDPRLIMSVTAVLHWRQWLYIHREQQAMCIVDAA